TSSNSSIAVYRRSVYPPAAVRRGRMTGAINPLLSSACSCRAVRPVSPATSRELYVFFRRTQAQSIGRSRAREVFEGQPPFAVRRVAKGDAPVVDRDVGMMVRRFRLRHEAVDEGHSLRKVIEGVLLLDGGAVERPTAQLTHGALDLRSCQFHLA